MNNFFEQESNQQPQDQQQVVEETTEQEVEQLESDPSFEAQEGEGFASEEEYEEYEEDAEGESVDYESIIKEKDALIESTEKRYKAWAAALQSGIDKERESYKQQLVELRSQFEEIQNQSKRDIETSYDEDDFATQSQVRKLIEQQIRDSLSASEKEKRELEKARHLEKMESENFYASQPDYQEVKAFYDKHLANDSFVNSPTLHYRDQYAYVQKIMNQHNATNSVNKSAFKKNKKIKKKRTPPTGNPGRNFNASRTSNDFKALLEQSLKEVGNPKAFF